MPMAASLVLLDTLCIHYARLMLVYTLIALPHVTLPAVGVLE